MSRTRKGKKPPGFDYNAPRPAKGTKPQGMATATGPFWKNLTHRSERRIGKQTANLNPPQNDE